MLDVVIIYAVYLKWRGQDKTADFKWDKTADFESETKPPISKMRQNRRF